MADKIVIEIEAQFKDNVSGPAAKAQGALDKLKKTASEIGSKPIKINISTNDNASKTVDNVSAKAKKLGTTKADIMISANDKASKTVDNVSAKTEKLGNTKADVMVGAEDKASKTVDSVTAKAKKLGNTKADVMVSAKDKASQIISKITSSVKTITGKTWNVVISAKDKASSIISSITDKLFSLQTLAVGIFGGMAFNQGVISPIGFADRLENSFIGFETMFKSAEQATDMMNQIKEFARTTPFETEGVINSVQQMLRSGAWDQSNVIDGIEKIGNAAAAAGKGTAGVEAIVLALQQMSMSGRVNAQDMLQLTSQGIAGWQMLADYYGKSLAEVRKMSEDGEISAEDGIKAIMKGMEAYDGMMDKISTRTASGLLSNIKDTFDLSIVEKWGKGLQSGAISGLTKFATWLEKISPMLDRAGASLEDIGSYISTKFFGLLEKGWTNLENIINSDEFINADGIGGKMKVLFSTIGKDLLSVGKDILGSLWDSATSWLSEKAPDIGGFIGKWLSKGIISFSDFITGALGGEVSGLDSIASDMGASFWEAFTSAFNAEKVKSSVSNAIKSIFSSALKIIPGGESPTASSFVSAALIGGTLKATGIGSIIGKGLKWGGGKLLTGLGSVTGGYGIPAAGVGLLALDSGSDFNTSYVNYKKGNTRESVASAVEGGTTFAGILAGMGAGAAYGAGTGALAGGVGAIPGAIIGALLGGIAGWSAGKGAGNIIRSTAPKEDNVTYSTREMQEAIQDADMSAEELNSTFQKAVKNDMAKHFGDVALSLQEIDDIAQKVTFGNNIDNMTAYAEAVNNANQSLSNFAAAGRDVEKWNIKTKMGLDIESDDISDYVSDINNMVESALSYVDDKQYEVNASINLLFGDDTEGANNILSGINAMYADIQSQISGTKLELDAYIQAASSDGIITIDEQAEIQKLTEKINNITQAVADATNEASAELLQMKFGNENMTSDNFLDLQSAITQRVQEATQSYDESFTSSLAALKLRMKLDPDFSETDYTAAVDELKQHYQQQFNDMKIEVNNLQLDFAANAYDDVFGTTAEEMKKSLELALNTALSTGVDPIEWSDQQLGKMLNLDDLSGMSPEIAAQLKQILSNIFNSQPVETEFDVTADPDVTVNEPDTPDIAIPSTETSADVTVNPNVTVNQPESTPDMVIPPTETTADVTVTPNYILSQGEGPRAAQIPSLQDMFSNNPISFDDIGVDINVNPHYNVLSGNQLSAEDVQPTNTPTTTADVTVNANYNVTPTSMPAESVTPQTASTTADITVNATYTENTYQPPHFTASTTADVAISATYTQNKPTFGPYSASASAHVTIHATYSLDNQPCFGGSGSSISVSANGRIAKTPTLSWVAEEGYPEAIIPFNPSRRGRALSLWYETGRYLGVMNNANGGIIGGNSTPLPAPATSDIKIGASGSNSGSSVTVKLDKGSIQINITADSSQTVSEAIETQKESIANEIAGVLNKALGAQFANMPMKVKS